MQRILRHQPVAAALGAFVAATSLFLTALAVPAESAFPGGNGKIAFESRADGTANSEIYTMNADGTAQTNRTNNAAAHDSQPTWSPDGSKIAFTSGGPWTDPLSFEIYTMNADGTGQTRRTNNTEQDQQPTWAPDGIHIAFQTFRAQNNEIYTMRYDGFGQTNRTNNAASDEQPAWSPDGTKIAFVSDRDGNKEIYTMNPDGTGQTRLTVGGTVVDQDPAWSPDGTKIAFTSNRDFGNNEIYTMNADGTGQTNRTNNAGTPTAASDAQPAWSPDGTKIAFVSFRDGNSEIYTMNADGTGQTRRTNSAALDINPDWQAVIYQHPFYNGGSIHVSLVPAMRQTISAAQCSARGGTPSTHAAPFAVTSCDPPTPVVGTSAYFGSEGTGYAYLSPQRGDPTNLVDDADYYLDASLGDIRTGSLEGADYTPDLRMLVKLRITDKLNCAPPGCNGPYYRAGTAADLDFGVPIDCVETVDPGYGAYCSVETSADAVTPGAITESRQTVISVNRVRINDAGLDNISGNADDKLFALQGAYIP